jgi:hypothetical protein
MVEMARISMEGNREIHRTSPDLFPDTDENNNTDLFPYSPRRKLRFDDWPENLFPFPADKDQPYKPIVPDPSSSSSSSSSSASSSSDSSGDRTCDDDRDLDFEPEKEKEHKSDHEFEDTPRQLAPPKQGYKRKRNPENWEKNKLKELRNAGKEFVSPSSVVQPKKVRERCGPKCRFECKSITDEQRQAIFSGYWALDDVDKKRYFLSNLMKPIVNEKKCRRLDSAGNIKEPRKDNNAFYLTVEKEDRRVCKVFFINTFDVSDKVIRTVVKKKTDLPSGLAILPDLRGKHKNQVKLPQNERNRILSFINSIPRIPSHYLRAQTKREFIDGSKSVSELHRDYVKACKAENIKEASYSTFYHIFKTEFNISFFTPKKDQCETCAAFGNSSEEEKTLLKEKHDQHILEKELSRKEMKEDSQNGNIITAIFDLQAVMQLPKGDVSLFYYSSKLNAFNLTFLNPNSMVGHCYVWDESVGHRGANEIGSCLLNYVTKGIENRPGSDVVLYTDNCGGQQKNQFMVALYLYMVQTMDIASLTHKFLIKGHTQNLCDNIHSVIERKIERVLKSGPIYTPEGFTTAIKGAKVTGEPYKLTEMDYDDFLDLKQLAKDLQLSMTNVKISEVVAIKVISGHPKSLFYKYSYESDKWEEAIVIKKKNVLLENIVLKNAFLNKPGLDTKKKDALLKLCDKRAIPMKFRPYFESL